MPWRLTSGSSAAMLSREVATSMRGRGFELVVHPFSFAEAQAHNGRAVPGGSLPLAGKRLSTLEHDLRAYLTVGGFPEVQRLDLSVRRAALHGLPLVLEILVEPQVLHQPIEVVLNTGARYARSDRADLVAHDHVPRAQFEQRAVAEGPRDLRESLAREPTGADVKIGAVSEPGAPREEPRAPLADAVDRAAATHRRARPLGTTTSRRSEI